MPNVDAAPARLFTALGDVTRLDLIGRLSDGGERSIGQLGHGLPISRQAVAKHLGILEEAGLVVTVRRGKEKLHYLNPVPLRLLYDRWLRKFDEPRADALIALRNSLEAP